LSDSSKKPDGPEGGPERDNDEYSEEDIFQNTSVGTVPKESSSHEPSPEESPAEPIQETIESFDALEDIQLDPSEPPELSDTEDQQAPAFASTKLSELGELSPEEPAQPPFVSEFSDSLATPKSGQSTGEITSQTTESSKTIDSIKNYSESLNSESSATAQLPFTLRIEGKLSPQEAEKLLDVLSREKMDIREVDLEPQFEAGRVLIPRISEYAGVMLIQALRGVRAKIYFQPSDTEPEPLSDSLDKQFGNFDSSFLNANEPAPLTAESLPVTQGDDLPQLGFFQVIDTLIVSGMLSTRSVEALNSTEFTTLTEALMRELKFKAVRRGARGIIHLSIQLVPLTLPTDYRVTVSGTAVN
jgi:hypothetical protein